VRAAQGQSADLTCGSSPSVRMPSAEAMPWRRCGLSPEMDTRALSVDQTGARQMTETNSKNSATRSRHLAPARVAPPPRGTRAWRRPCREANGGCRRTPEADRLPAAVVGQSSPMSARPCRPTAPDRSPTCNDSRPTDSQNSYSNQDPDICFLSQ